MNAAAALHVAVVRERLLDGPVPLYGHALWRERFPWLVQGTTGRDFDLGWFGGARADDVWQRWFAVRQVARCARLVQARQVHGARIIRHEPGPAGHSLVDDADGHITAHTGILLAVSVADCVPVFLVHEGARRIALLHAGWRGVAAGILEAGLDALTANDPAALQHTHVHLGPSICGQCYEVGAEVHEALGRRGEAGRRTVDLRALLIERALERGIAPRHASVSEWCTRCGNPPFYSHRAGHRERQAAILGMLPE
jgi:YfiH family protein